MLTIPANVFREFLCDLFYIVKGNDFFLNKGANWLFLMLHLLLPLLMIDVT